MRYKITFSYDGSNFYGYQVQPGLRTVQSELEKAVSFLNRKTNTVTVASGRTDAGVHSLGQTANFKTENETIPTEKFPIAINSKLKKSIVIKSAEEVEDRFHSRYSVKSKRYRYVINNSDMGTAIYRDLEYHFPIKLDVDKMNKAAKYFEGEHDFAGFKASGTSSKSSVRKIYKAEVYKDGDRINIELTGNGFLYNMVRIISGTLLDVGMDKIKVEDVPEIIESKDRKKAGRTLPAHGLYLVEVSY